MGNSLHEQAVKSQVDALACSGPTTCAVPDYTAFYCRCRQRGAATPALARSWTAAVSRHSTPAPCASADWRRWPWTRTPACCWSPPRSETSWAITPCICMLLVVVAVRQTPGPVDSGSRVPVTAASVSCAQLQAHISATMLRCALYASGSRDSLTVRCLESAGLASTAHWRCHPGKPLSIEISQRSALQQQTCQSAPLQTPCGSPNSQ